MQQLEVLLKEDFRTVQKFPLIDESAAFRELHELVKDEESTIIFDGEYLRINNKVLDIENKVYFIVADEIMENE